MLRNMEIVKPWCNIHSLRYPTYSEAIIIMTNAVTLEVRQNIMFNIYLRWYKFKVEDAQVHPTLIRNWSYFLENVITSTTTSFKKFVLSISCYLILVEAYLAVHVSTCLTFLLNDFFPESIYICSIEEYSNNVRDNAR